jgi:hypothetical protein
VPNSHPFKSRHESVLVNQASEEAEGSIYSSTSLTRHGELGEARQPWRSRSSTCGCPETRPSSSCRYPVLMNQAAQTIGPSQMGQLWIDDRCRI